MNSQKEFEKIIIKLTKLRESKNSDYGDGFLNSYNKYGKEALFFDMLRKWTRIENLLLKKSKNEVSSETVQDTLGDLAVMCINGMIWLNQNDISQKTTK